MKDGRNTRVFEVFVLLVTAAISATAQSAYDQARFVAIDLAVDPVVIIAAASNPETAVRRAALWRLREIGHSGAESAAMASLDDPSWSVREMAAALLARRGSERSIAALQSRMEIEKVSEVREAIVRALATLGAAHAPLLIGSFRNDPNFAVRGAVYGELISRSTCDSAAALLAEAKLDAETFVRTAAASAYERFDPPASPPPERNLELDYLLLVGLIMTVTCAWFILLLYLGWKRRWIPLGTILLATAVAVPLVIQAVPRPAYHAGIDVLIDPEIDFDHLSGSAFSPDEFLRELKGRVAPSLDGLSVDWKVLESSLEYAHRPERNQWDGAAIQIRLYGEMQRGERKRAAIVITDKDIFGVNTARVYGLGEQDVAIFSLHRLDPFFLEEGGEGSHTRNELLRRASNLFLHQVGHVYKLAHCPNTGCSMRAFDAVEDLYFQDEQLCPACRDRIQEKLSSQSAATRRRP